MFAYCNNNPVRYVDSFGTNCKEVDAGLTGFTYSVEEKFRFSWGTVTVIASYEVKIVDGYTLILNTIEVEVTDSDIVVTMPDGTSFCYEYDWTGINPDSYTKTISQELGLEMVLDDDGLGLSMANDTPAGTFNLQVQIKPSMFIILLESVAEGLPPVGGVSSGGPWELHNNTLFFK